MFFFSAYRKSETQDLYVGLGTQYPKMGPYGGTLRWDPSVRCKSSNSQLFFKIGVLKYFAIFTGKHWNLFLCWNLFLINEAPTLVVSY